MSSAWSGHTNHLNETAIFHPIFVDPGAATEIDLDDLVNELNFSRDDRRHEGVQVEGRPLIVTAGATVFDLQEDTPLQQDEYFPTNATLTMNVISEYFIADADIINVGESSTQRHERQR